MLRSISEILDKAVANSLIRLDAELKPKTIKRTGNKKALHQKAKNARLKWKH